MGYPATVQKIERKKSTQAQWYVNFPNALAQTMNFEKGEEIEWEVMDIAMLKMIRTKKKKKLKGRTARKLIQ